MTALRELIKSAKQLGCKVLENEPMRLHTSFKIGGPARVFIESGDAAALGTLLRQCHETGIPRLILGRGSNLLVADEGLSGAVLRLTGTEPSRFQDGMIRCVAGVSLSSLCRFALKNGISGLEFAWGIPGSAGGAAYMNAGAYGGEMKQLLISCEHITPEGLPGFLPADRMELAYRHSAYAENGCLITALRLAAKPGDKPEIEARMKELYRRREEKQPLNFPSAGSVFKRPPGSYAGTLIESCGLKGKSVGGAQVSEKHAGFIINTGGALCGDVLRLIDLIQEEVLRQTGISLECEIKTVRF